MSSPRLSHRNVVLFAHVSSFFTNNTASSINHRNPFSPPPSTVPLQNSNRKHVYQSLHQVSRNRLCLTTNQELQSDLAHQYSKKFVLLCNGDVVLTNPFFDITIIRLILQGPWQCFCWNIMLARFIMPECIPVSSISLCTIHQHSLCTLPTHSVPYPNS